MVPVEPVSGLSTRSASRSMPGDGDVRRTVSQSDGVHPLDLPALASIGLTAAGGAVLASHLGAEGETKAGAAAERKGEDGDRAPR